MSEIPGGKVDESDSGVAAAAVREVREETGPRVARFAAQLRLMLCTTSKAASSSAGVVSKRAIQPNYVVAVDWVGDGEVVLSEDEHAGFVWAAEDELDGLDMTGEMRGVVREAFDVVGRVSRDGLGFRCSQNPECRPAGGFSRSERPLIICRA